MTKILIVEDNAAFLDECTQWLQRPGCEIHGARNVEDGLRLLPRLMPNLIMLDLRLPPSNDPSEGLRLLRESLKVNPHGKVIVLTVEARKEIALEAIRKGAEDFLIKPVDPDVLAVVVERALKKQELELELRELRGQVNREGPFPGVIGRSRIMRELLDLICKVAASNVSVLVSGESGVGKEVVARAIHNLGSRKNQRLVTVNCAAIAENIQESELFGHEQWAFTDARKSHVGAFELADGGTIFLDEIESTPLKTQAKLLRVIEEKCIRRVGGTVPKPVDFRIIAATNRDLKSLVSEGGFREDLYYRLNTICLRVPALREHKEDIEALADHFLHRFSQEENKKIFGFDDEVIRILENDNWPGNVRELKNEIHWLVIQAEDNQMICREHLSAAIRGEAGGVTPEARGSPRLREAVEEFERGLLLRAIERNQGNIKRAADELGITRQNLYFKMNKYGITQAP